MSASRPQQPSPRAQRNLRAWMAAHTYDWWEDDNGVVRMCVEECLADGTWITAIDTVGSVSEARDLMGY